MTANTHSQGRHSGEKAFLLGSGTAAAMVEALHPGRWYLDTAITH